jgi:hypothetical protein
MFENRVCLLNKTHFKQRNANKMIVISDGDLIKNQLDKNSTCRIGL